MSAVVLAVALVVLAVVLFLAIAYRHRGAYHMVLGWLPADAVHWSTKGWYSYYADTWGVTFDTFHPWFGAAVVEVDYPEDDDLGDLCLGIDEAEERIAANAAEEAEIDAWEAAKAVMHRSPIVSDRPSLTPTQAFYSHQW